MDNSDKANFKELFDALSELYGQKEKPSTIILQMTFAALERFTFAEVSGAASEHVAKSKFFPRPADLVEILDGKKIKAEHVLASARLANTPLGILARIHIGTHDLNTQNSFYLADRAEECLQLMPEWQSRASRGDYSDHEISIMLKHGVNPTAPFAFGLAQPVNAQQLAVRAEAIKKTPRHAFLIEPPHSEKRDQREPANPMLAKFVDEIINEPKKPALTEGNPNDGNNTNPEQP